MREIRADWFTSKGHKCFIDAWDSKLDNESGTVVARIDELGNVSFLDEDASKDNYIRKIIEEVV